LARSWRAARLAARSAFFWAFSSTVLISALYRGYRLVAPALSTEHALERSVMARGDRRFCAGSHPPDLLEHAEGDPARAGGHGRGRRCAGWRAGRQVPR